MVRLMLVLAPVACILSGIGISSILSTYMKVIGDLAALLMSNPAFCFRINFTFLHNIMIVSICINFASVTYYL